MVIVFAIVTAQATLGALYEPCRSAIVPLLAPGEEEMKVATTIAGLAWSVMAALGSAMGGFMVSIVGVRACFSELFSSHDQFIRIISKNSIC